MKVKRFYMKDSAYLDALQIYFDYSEISEVEKIIKTIIEKQKRLKPTINS